MIYLTVAELKAFSLPVFSSLRTYSLRQTMTRCDWKLEIEAWRFHKMCPKATLMNPQMWHQNSDKQKLVNGYSVQFSRGCPVHLKECLGETGNSPFESWQGKHFVGKYSVSSQGTWFASNVSVGFCCTLFGVMMSKPDHKLTSSQAHKLQVSSSKTLTIDISRQLSTAPTCTIVSLPIKVGFHVFPAEGLGHAEGLYLVLLVLLNQNQSDRVGIRRK